MTALEQEPLESIGEKVARYSVPEGASLKERATAIAARELYFEMVHKRKQLMAFIKLPVYQSIKADVASSIGLRPLFGHELEPVSPRTSTPSL
jgi:hypothetical protein